MLTERFECAGIGFEQSKQVGCRRSRVNRAALILLESTGAATEQLTGLYSVKPSLSRILRIIVARQKSV